MTEAPSFDEYTSRDYRWDFMKNGETGAGFRLAFSWEKTGTTRGGFGNTLKTLNKTIAKVLTILGSTDSVLRDGARRRQLSSKDCLGKTVATLAGDKKNCPNSISAELLPDKYLTRLNLADKLPAGAFSKSYLPIVYSNTDQMNS